jgi:hypothetical protein
MRCKRKSSAVAQGIVWSTKIACHIRSHGALKQRCIALFQLAFASTSFDSEVGR